MFESNKVHLQIEGTLTLLYFMFPLIYYLLVLHYILEEQII